MGIVRWWTVGVVLFLTAGACGDQSAAPALTPPRSTATQATTAASDPSGETAIRHALLDLPSWDVRSAVDYEIDPDLGDNTDWWVEHERYVSGDAPGTGVGSSLRLSGHPEPVAVTAETLTGFGFGLDPVTIAGADGFAGIGGDGPAIVIWPLRDDYTLMILSYELGVDDLIELAGTARAVTVEEWVEAGGEIRPCLPGTPDCDAVTGLD